MKCMVCGSLRTQDVSVCPVCGFSFMKVAGRDERSVLRLRRFADRYLQETLGRVQISLKIFGYKKTPDGLEFVKEQILPLASYRDLQGEEIRWNAKRFSKIRKTDASGSGESAKAGTLQLEIQIRNASRDKSEFVTVKVTPPLLDKDWHVGISKPREGVILLHVGDPDTSAASGEINLFACSAVREQVVKGGVSA